MSSDKLSTKQFRVSLDNIVINNIPYADYIKSFLEELHTRTDKIDVGRMLVLENLIEKMVDPQFLQTLITQLNEVFADGKVNSNDIPALMVIMIHLLNTQLPRLKNVKFSNEDLKEVIMIIFDSLLDKGIGKLELSDIEKESLNKLISSCFELLLMKLHTNGTLDKILSKIKFILCCGNN